MWSVQVVVMAWMSRMVFWAAALMARSLAAVAAGEGAPHAVRRSVAAAAVAASG
jgi:hypothetical protein